MTVPIEAIELFAGIGGFGMAMERAGIQIAMQCEIDKNALKVLDYHWSDVPKIKDVKLVSKTTFNRPVDLICGGFPCQNTSPAGKREGLAGAQSGLWFEYLRIVQELKPRWVVIENSPGLLSTRNGRDFAIVVRGLAECGYCVAYRILDSQYFGVPQRRRRLFIVASFGNGSAAEILFEPESYSRDTAPRQYAPEAAATGIRSSDAGTGSSTVRVFDARGNGLGSLSPTLVGSHLDRITDYTPVLLTEDGVRRLTPVETERLQGFPDHWTAVAGAADGTRYRQTGNAVSVPVVEWIMRRLVEVDSRNKE